MTLRAVHNKRSNIPKIKRSKQIIMERNWFKKLLYISLIINVIQYLF